MVIAADLENKIQGDSARKIYFAQGVYCVSTEAGDRKTANVPGMRSVGCQGIMEAEAQEMDTFRIHGDNIVECERIMSVIVNTLKPSAVLTSLVSPSTLSVRLEAEFRGRSVNWRFELLPGFNKNTKRRWESNIFDALKSAGSFFDETPDAIITSINQREKTERILLGIEFCSALQAGNQAWQRSARALSVGPHRMSLSVYRRFCEI